MDVEKFINLVKNQPILYDRRHKSYNNFTKKAKVWDMIAAEMNESSDVLRTKWKGLKDGYTKYKKQINDPNATNCKGYYNWCWAEHLQFLEHNGRRKSKNNTSTASIDDNSMETPDACPQEMSTDNEIFFAESSEAQNDFSVPESSALTQAALQSSRFIEPHLRSSSKRYRPSVDESEVQFMRGKRSKSSDAIDLLFQSYAETFKSFSIKRQVSLKVQLAKLFGDAEMAEMQDISLVFSPAADEASGHDYQTKSRDKVYNVLQLSEFPEMKQSPASERSSEDL